MKEKIEQLKQKFSNIHNIRCDILHSIECCEKIFDNKKDVHMTASVCGTYLYNAKGHGTINNSTKMDKAVDVFVEALLEEHKTSINEGLLLLQTEFDNLFII